MVASCAEKTYTATTIADVVAGARISRTTFYREFDDKRACFEAAVAYALDEVRAATGRAWSAEEPPAQAVRRCTAAMLDLFAARPQLAQLLLSEAVAVEPAVFDRYRELAVPAVAALWEDEADPSHLDPWLAFGRAELLVLDRVTEEPERLPELLPELVYLAVAPFEGHEAALSEAGASKALAGAGAGAP